MAEETIREPAIVGYGRSNVDEYQEHEYRESLERAFVAGGADFIALDSNMRGQRFRAAGVAWAIDAGFLSVSEVDGGDEQCEVATFRLTEAGRKEFGLA